jgi:AhpD family alkylhydroperoxidase
MGRQVRVRADQLSSIKANTARGWYGCDRNNRKQNLIQDWAQLIANMNIGVKNLRQGSPEATKGFSALAQRAHAGTALDHKTKELIALVISVATHCQPCIAYHAEATAKQGASRKHVLETMGMAIYMVAGPSVVYAAQALEALDQLQAKPAK